VKQVVCEHEHRASASKCTYDLLGFVRTMHSREQKSHCGEEIRGRWPGDRGGQRTVVLGEVGRGESENKEDVL
jgi:hypothetical protein